MKRLSMRKIRDAPRLQAGGLSTRKIAASPGLGQSTASEYLGRARAAGLGWPLPEGLTDADLEQAPVSPHMWHSTGNIPAARLGVSAP